MPRYLDFDKVDYLDNDVLVYGKRVYDIACGDKLPFENVAPVIHAHWINHFDDLFPVESTVKCSNCHEEQMTLLDNNYCPNCGARMDEVVNDA